MNKKLRGNLLLVLTAFIWGSAFVAQSAGMEYVGPFTYTMSRNFIGFLVLIPLIAYFTNKNKQAGITSHNGSSMLPDKNTLIGGLCCGVFLLAASLFQQVGISMTSVGKAGFITTLYIIIVPILGIFLHKKVPRIIWLCVLLAIVGFYLLCVKEGFSIGEGDLLVLVCAFLFSLHILVIDHFVYKGVDGVKMSCIQFLVAGILGLILTLIFEEPTWGAIWDAKWTILYAGVLSSGVAYTLQIIAQKDTDPTTATLIMSLESVFAALSGWAFLHEVLSIKELCGCALVFVAVILAQIRQQKPE